MPLLLLIRHGENDFVKTGRMAGHTPGVHLNERGREQADELAEALKDVPLAAIYSSPLERAIETAAPIARLRQLETQVKDGLIESFIGDWQGLEIKAARKFDTWGTLQNHPSRFRFPGGESIQEQQTRIVTAIEEIARNHAPHEIVALVFHADPIKLAVTYYLGMPLDNFQRIGVDTASVTVLHLGREGASLVKQNMRAPFKFPVPSGPPAKKNFLEKLLGMLRK